MTSDFSGTARDLLYLAFLFFGAGTGCFLNRFRARAKTGFRNRSVTLGFVLYACAACVFAIMLIVSGGRIQTHFSVYITGFVLAALALPAVRFPRAAGFPVVIAAGIVIVWTAYSFGQFPLLNNPGSRANIGCLEMDGQYTFGTAGDQSKAQFPRSVISADSVLEITITSFEYAFFFPVIGGERRGKITRLNVNGTNLYHDIRFENGLLGFWAKTFKKDYLQDRNDFIKAADLELLLTDQVINQDKPFFYRIFYHGESLISFGI